MNAGPKTACGGKRPQAGVGGQPLAGDSRAILRAAENESFSPEKHVISTRPECTIPQSSYDRFLTRFLPSFLALRDYPQSGIYIL